MPFARVLTAVAVSAAALLTGVPAAMAAAGATTAAPWLQTSYNAAAASANPAESALGAAVVKRLVRAQTQTSSDGCPTGRVAAVSGRLLYSVVGDSLRVTRTDTGATVWQVPLLGDDERYVSIAVSDGLVVLASNGEVCETNDPIGLVRAYRATDGSLAWQGRVSFPDGVSGMAVSGRRVIAYARAGIESAAAVYVLRLGTGTLLWSTAKGGPPDPAVCDTAPAVVGGYVFDDHLRDPAQPDGCGGEQPALELRAHAVGSGTVSWTKQGSYTVVRGDTDTAGVVAHLYVRDNSTGALLDLDPATGATRFALAGATTVLAVDAQRVYALCSATDATACAFDKGTGALQWQAALTHPWLSGSHHAVEADGVLYLSNGELRTTAGGALLRTLAGDVVAVGEGHVVAFDPSTEALLVYGPR